MYTFLKRTISMVLVVSFLLTAVYIPVNAEQLFGSGKVEDIANKGIEDCGTNNSDVNKRKTVLGNSTDDSEFLDDFLDPVKDKEYILQRQKENLV